MDRKEFEDVVVAVTQEPNMISAISQSHVTWFVTDGKHARQVIQQDI